jgi:gluconolactonase
MRHALSRGIGLRRRLMCLVAAAVVLAPATRLTAAEPQVIVRGLRSPESVTRGPDGRLYVTEIGRSGVNGDGALAVIEGDQPKEFAKGLDDPMGLVVHGHDFFVADKNRVWRIDATGTTAVYAAADAFPTKPLFLNDIEASPQGDIYVSDCGLFVSNGAIFCIKPSKEIVVVVSQKTAPELKAPNGMLMDGPGHLLFVDFTSGRLNRLNLADGKAVELARGLGSTDGLTRDAKGRIYTSDWRGGRIFVMNSQSDQPRLLLKGFKSPADIYFDAQTGRLLIPDTRAGTITAVTLED